LDDCHHAFQILLDARYQHTLYFPRNWALASTLLTPDLDPIELRSKFGHGAPGHNAAGRMLFHRSLHMIYSDLQVSNIMTDNVQYIGDQEKIKECTSMLYLAFQAIKTAETIEAVPR
jgi:hypothetical protein